MANLGLALRDSPVQLRTLNRRREQKDNSDLIRKVVIRSHLSKEVRRANVFLAGCGFGLMFKNVWREKARYTLAIDTSAPKISDFMHHFPKIDARCADAIAFADWPEGVIFQIADFDAFGDPYPMIRTFFAGKKWTAPLVVIVGDARVLHFRRTGVVSPELWNTSRKGTYRGLRNADTYMNKLVWPWWSRLSRKNHLTIKERMITFNRGRSVVYYGLQLDASL